MSGDLFPGFGLDSSRRSFFCLTLHPCAWLCATTRRTSRAVPRRYVSTGPSLTQSGETRAARHNAPSVRTGLMPGAGWAVGPSRAGRGWRSGAWRTAPGHLGSSCSRAGWGWVRRGVIRGNTVPIQESTPPLPVPQIAWSERQNLKAKAASPVYRVG